MKKETEKRYIKRFDTHMQDRKMTPASIIERLNELAKEQTPESWRETRNAFATAIKHYAKRWGRGEEERVNSILELYEEVKAMPNPVPLGERKKASKRVKKVSPEDIQKLLDAAARIGGDDGLIAEATITLMQLTGARPNELPFIMKLTSTSIAIPGSKMRSDRGLNREIQFESAGDAARVLDRVKRLNEALKGHKDMTRKMRDAFKQCAIAAFPRRSNLPTPYSLRHQFGSDLKASGLDRLTIAYMMGHQATASVEKYGNGKSGSGSALKASPAVDSDTISSLVRVTHKEPPAGPKIMVAAEREFEYDNPDISPC